jgi:hypothetical protein
MLLQLQVQEVGLGGFGADERGLGPGSWHFYSSRLFGHVSCVLVVLYLGSREPEALT